MNKISLQEELLAEEENKKTEEKKDIRIVGDIKYIDNLGVWVAE